MRKVKEWIGKTDDSAVPLAVMLRIHAKTAGRCAECGIKPAPGRFHFDHIIALCNAGQHRENNLQLLCLPCHKEKTRADAAEKAKVTRVKAKHLGIIKTPRYKIKSRGFAKAEPQRTASRPLKRHQDSQP